MVNILKRYEKFDGIIVLFYEYFITNNGSVKG